MSNKSYFHVVKTDKSINDITDKISDRLIITKSGKMYFDYDANTRLELSTTSSSTGGTKYNVYNSITPLYNLNSDQSLKYTDITDMFDTVVSEVIINSLIFDKQGNYGIILEDHPEWQNVKVRVLGIITDYLRKDFAGENGSIITNFVIAQEDSSNIEFTISDYSISTNEVSNTKYRLTSSNNSLKYNYENNVLDTTINISTNESNILKLIDDGLIVSTYTKEEIDDLFLEVSSLEFVGPYESIDIIPKPYLHDKIYLVGTNAPYDTYVYSTNELIFFGNSSLSNTYSKAEIDDIIEDVISTIDDTVDESITIERY